MRTTTTTLGFSRVSKARVLIRVSVSIRVSLVLVTVGTGDRISRRGVSGVICRIPDL